MENSKEASRLFNIIRVFSDIKSDIEEVFKKYKLNSTEDKLFILSILADEYFKGTN